MRETEGEKSKKETDETTETSNKRERESDAKKNHEKNRGQQHLVLIRFSSPRSVPSDLIIGIHSYTHRVVWSGLVFS